MSAAAAPILNAVGHPIDDIYLAIQTGIIALGVYCNGKQVQSIQETIGTNPT